MIKWLRKKLGIDELERRIAALEPPLPPTGRYVWDRKQPRENWPASINGIKVGYVQVGVPKSPLFEMLWNPLKQRHDSPKVFERMSLRDGITTDAKRIIAKAPHWFMVRADGDVWGHGNPRPFGEEIDGDDLFYMVMREQVIDGITLIDHDLPEVFLHFKAVVDTFMPGA